MALTLLRPSGSPSADVRNDAGRRSPRPHFEPHIQGLRALAVASVVLYHLWPTHLPGGYVGVDVFFVISGYLICGHLSREVESTGSVRLLVFWGRRIRRLIPAALVVLLAAVIFVVVAVPAAGWAQNLSEVRAAALYVENWQLVANAVDYLAAQNAPSLVQHFWSLSVEEQFYFLQPLLLLVAIKVFPTRHAIRVVLIAAVVLSLPFSIALTASDAGVAYFSTGTRAWEFAVGGLVAVVGQRVALTSAARAVLGWVGLGLVGAALLAYSPATPFPGWAAALPVLGTALALRFGGERAALGPGRVLELRPMRTVGDWSYSIYLWHWPLIVAAPLVLGGPSGWKVKLLVLLFTVLLAASTKRFVEDRWRGADAGPLPWRTYLAMGLAVLLIAGGTTALIRWQSGQVSAQAGRAQAALASVAERCLGIDAVANDCPRPFAVTDSVAPAAAADDVPWNIGIAASRNCPGAALSDPPVAHACTFNDPSSPTSTVALVGDSHADHLIDPLGAYAGEHGWRFITYTREGCSGIPSTRLGNADCRAWSEAVQRELQSRKDIDAVVFSNYASAAEWTAEDEAAAWRALRLQGKAVVPVVDVPGMPKGVSGPQCVAAHVQEYDPCTRALPERGKTEIAAAALGIPAVSLNDLLCKGGTCHSVIGGEMVYMDEAHLTFHFASSLREVLGSRLSSVLDRESKDSTHSG